jgi:multiple sugar transport system substrate-binding protein
MRRKLTVKTMLPVCLLLALGLVFLSVQLFASGEKTGVPGEGGVVTEGVKLRVAFVPGLTELPPIEDCLRMAAQELGAEIEVSNYSFDELHDKLVLDYTGGNQVWDYVFVQSATRAEWFESGLIYPIGTYIDENPDNVDSGLLAMDDWFQVSMDENTLDGVLTSLPLYVTGTTMYYRTDIMDDRGERAAFKARYGYELGPPETYDQFMDVAEFFTRSAGEKLAGETLRADFYGASHSNKPINFMWFDFVNYLMAFGADNIYNPDTMMPTVNSREAIAAAQYYVDLVPYLPPGHLTMASGASTAMFAEGNVAMIIEFFGRGAVMALNPENSKVSDKIAFTVNPSVPGVGRPHASIHSGNGLALYSLSKNMDAAYKVMELAFSPRIMKAVAVEKYLPYGWICPRPSVLLDPSVTSMAPHLEIAGEELLDARQNYFFFLPTLPEYPQAMDIAGTALSKALAGEEDVVPAFNRAQEELEELFKKAGYMR